MGRSPGRHHPAETVENRRAGADLGTPYLDPLQQRVSLAERLRRSLHGSALLKNSTVHQNRSIVPRARRSVRKKTLQRQSRLDLHRTKSKTTRHPVPRSKINRPPPTSQPQFTTGEKSGLISRGPWTFVSG